MLQERRVVARNAVRMLRILCGTVLISTGTSSYATQAEAQLGPAGHGGPTPAASASASASDPAHGSTAAGHDMAAMPAAASAERDPHAYADGFTLDAGPYAGATRLHLADEQAFGAVLLDRVELQRVDGDDPTVYDIQAWYGTTYDRLWAKVEGDLVDGRAESTQNELFYSRAVATFWDLQAGVRLDTYEDANDATWLAFGFQGLAPYWFEVDATAYIGDGGATALSVEAEYDLFLTQRLILQPRVEVNAYGDSDRERGLGRGLSDAEAGLRLRYEFDRRFAPYVGVQWTRKFGNAADFAKTDGNPTSEAMVIAGLRMWF